MVGPWRSQNTYVLGTIRCASIFGIDVLVRHGVTVGSAMMEGQ